jgi:hypothetical protein
MEPDSKSISLDEIKAKINAQPKAFPVTTLDFAAMHAAIDRFQAETQQKELREWLIYQAPPGVYDMYLQERKRLQKQDEEQIRRSNRFTGVIVLIFIAFIVWNFYSITHMGYPR